MYQQRWPPYGGGSSVSNLSQILRWRFYMWKPGSWHVIILNSLKYSTRRQQRDTMICAVKHTGQHAQFLRSGARRRVTTKVRHCFRHQSCNKSEGAANLIDRDILMPLPSQIEQSVQAHQSIFVAGLGVSHRYYIFFFRREFQCL